MSFTLEVVLRIVADPARPWKFFVGGNWRWNLFDLVIVIFMLPVSHVGSWASGVRILRLLTIVKLLRRSKQLAMIIAGLTAGVRATTFIVVLMMLVDITCNT